MAHDDAVAAVCAAATRIQAGLDRALAMGQRRRATMTTSNQTVADELQYAAEVGAEIAERYRLLSGRVDVLSDEERRMIIDVLAYESGALLNEEGPEATHKLDPLLDRIARPDAVVVVLTRTEDE